MYGEEYYDPENLSATHKRAVAAYALFSLVYGLARNIIEEQFEFKTGSKAEIRNFVEEAIATFVDGTAAKLFVE